MGDKQLFNRDMRFSLTTKEPGGCSGETSAPFHSELHRGGGGGGDPNDFVQSSHVVTGYGETRRRHWVISLVQKMKEHVQSSEHG